MKKYLINSTVLAVSVIALSALSVPQAQADTSVTNYPGLMCQPHQPTTASYSYGSDTDINNDAAFGTDLGMNCSIPRSQGDRELKSVTVFVRDVDATLTDPDPELSSTSCHTHNETLTAGFFDSVIGPDVNTYNANGNFNAVTVPGPGAPVSSRTSFNLHCHIGGGASLHNYAVAVRR